MPNSPLLVSLGGSLREKSYSRAALREVLRIAEANGAATELILHNERTQRRLARLVNELLDFAKTKEKS